jgi:hypothetical protein
LWRPGLELLERLGIRRPVEKVGTPITALENIGQSQTWCKNASTAPELVTIEKTEVRRIFQKHLVDRLPSIDDPVQSIKEHQKNLQVLFTNGITETFDVVVTSNRGLLEEKPSTGNTHPVHWWGFDWPSQVSAPTVPTESLRDGTATITLPVREHVHTQLITEQEHCPKFPLELEDLANVFGCGRPALRNAILQLDQSKVQYERFDYDVLPSYSAGKVVLVGPAVHGTIPGDCLGPTLALEDGWVLADSLAYGPSTVEDALGQYADRRQRRMSALNERVQTLEAKEGRRQCVDLSQSIRQLCLYRSIAFSHVLDSQIDPFGTGIPNRL